MKCKWFVIGVLILSVALALGACGGEEPAAPADDTGGGQDQPAAKPTNTPKPTDTPVPTATPTPEPEEEFEPGTLVKPVDLNSFHSVIEMSWQGTLTNSETVEGSLNMSIEYVAEPLAQHIVISGDMPGMEEMTGEGGSLEIYVMPETTYMNLMGSWMSAPTQKDQFNVEDMAFGTSDNLIKDLKGVDYEGRETINGIETKHYSFDEKALNQGDFGVGSEIEDAKGDLYVAVEGGYLVRMQVTMSGKQFELPTGQGQSVTQGSFTMYMDLSSINEPIDIQVPAEALAGGAPQDVPIMADAEETASLGEMIAYKSATSVSEVADFYKAQMPANGWTETNSGTMGDIVTLDYSKDGRTASIMIMVDSQSGKTSVLITLGKE